eukprot:2537430-Prorocentrum_lima.AAC.1
MWASFPSFSSRFIAAMVATRSVDPAGSRHSTCHGTNTPTTPTLAGLLSRNPRCPRDTRPACTDR